MIVVCLISWLQHYFQPLSSFLLIAQVFILWKCWIYLYLIPSFISSENIWNKQPRTCKSMFRSNWSVCIMDWYSAGSQWSFHWVAPLLTAYGWVTGVCCWLLTWHHQQRNGTNGQAASYWNFGSCSSQFWDSETSWGKVESDLI